MRWKLALVSAVLFANIGIPPARAWQPPDDPEPIDGVSGGITWVQRPTFMEWGMIFNDHNVQHASAVVECVIAKNHHPKQCVVVVERPEHSRAGKAVARIAELYVAKSTDTEGKPTTGRKVRFQTGAGGGREL